MAKRKRRTPRRRTNRSLSASGSRAPRRRNRRRRGLSEAGKTSWLDSGKKTLMGGAGGLGAVVAHKLILPATAGKIPRILTALAGGLLASKFGAPSLGVGFTGGLVALTFQNGVLADEDNANYANENSLQDAPIYLDEDDNPMVLEEGEDGTSGLRYLNDDEITALHEAGAFEDYQLVS